MSRQGLRAMGDRVRATGLTTCDDRVPGMRNSARSSHAIDLQ